MAFDDDVVKTFNKPYESRLEEVTARIDSLNGTESYVKATRIGMAFIGIERTVEDYEGRIQKAYAWITERRCMVAAFALRLDEYIEKLDDLIAIEEFKGGIPEHPGEEPAATEATGETAQTAQSGKGKKRTKK